MEPEAEPSKPLSRRWKSSRLTALRGACGELEEKIAKLRRTEAERVDKMADSLKQTKGNLAASVSELETACSLQRFGCERDPVCVSAP